MDLTQWLTDPELVARFQRFCGVERLPDHSDTDELVEPDYSESNGVTYDKYVKHRHTHEYELKHNLQNGKVTDTDLQKEGVPPFASVDSDSDNGYRKSNQGRFRVTPHRINNVFLYYVFRVASFFGDEAFYLTFFPFVAWNMDALIVRQTTYLWSVCMYVGQIAKDIYQWPRPSSPTVVRLETDFAQEFSMPSTHAVAGSSIPFVMGYAIMNRYDVSIF